MSELERQTEYLRQWLRDTPRDLRNIASSSRVARSSIYRFMSTGKATITVLAALAREREKDPDNGSEAA